MNGLEKWCEIEEGENLKNELYQSCTLCPRECHADRLSGKKGACGENSVLRVGRAALHMWEEPCISGTRGSGTVFFSGCSLGCIFCQNRELSYGGLGKEISEERLAEIFLELQEKGAANINLVTGEHFVPGILEGLTLAKEQGLTLPVVYNSSGYEKPETIRLLKGSVDIWLPDFKYWDDELGLRFSGVPDYRERAMKAIDEMVCQTGACVFDEEGYLRKGVVVRHLLLPGHVKNSREVLRYLHDTYGNRIYISIMSQYTPLSKDLPFEELNRKVTRREYERLLDYALELGIENGFFQEGEAAKESFIPDFNGEGV